MIIELKKISLMLKCDTFLMFRIIKFIVSMYFSTKYFGNIALKFYLFILFLWFLWFFFVKKEWFLKLKTIYVCLPQTNSLLNIGIS